MPTVEGLTPSVVWTTIYGIIGLCLLFMIIYKVFDAIRNEIERSRRMREMREPDLADRVSKKVLEDLEPRFQDIEKNLTKDKVRLDNHEKLINESMLSQKDTREGLIAICKTLLVITGSSDDPDKMKEAHDELMKYLACRL
jgi:hypothetical protein